jgi:hypothetical protein
LLKSRYGKVSQPQLLNLGLIFYKQRSSERKALWLGEVKWLRDRKRIISVTEDGITLYVCSLRVRVLYFRSLLRARVLYLPCKPLTSGLES